MQAFVDESRRQSAYLLAAVVVAPAHLTEVRQALRAMLLPGQRRLHFVHERGERRKQVLDTLCGLPVSVRVYRSRLAPLRREPSTRAALLDALVDDLVTLGAHRLVLESRAGRDELDRRVLRARLAHHGVVDPVYEHLLGHEDPLLWAADAFAWAAGAGKAWRDRCAAVLILRDVGP